MLITSFAYAVNDFSWQWGAMAPSGINAYSPTHICKPTKAKIAVDVTYDWSTGITGRIFRAHVTLRCSAPGGGYTSFEGNTASSGHPSSGSGTDYPSPIFIDVTASGAYTAVVQVQYQEGGSGPWLPYATFTNTYAGPQLQFDASNASMDFTVKGKKQTGNGIVPTIVRCNGEELDIDGITGKGTVDHSEIKLESGTYEPASGTFMPFDWSVPFFPMTAYIGSAVPLTSTSVPWGHYFTIAGTGYIRVTVTLRGPCDPPGGVTKSMIFYVVDAHALIDFVLRNPYCTSSGGITGAQDRHPGLAFSSPGTLSAPGCHDGYLGANTCGVYMPDITAVGTTTVSNTNIRVDEVDAFGGIIGSPIVDFNIPSLATDPYYGFNDFLLGNLYFVDNYNAIKEVKTYKVTASVNTADCGPISNYSYFKIMDDGGSGSGRGWKNSGTVAGVLQSTINVYPNPASQAITFDCGNIKNNEGTLTVILSDMMGRVVLQQEGLQVTGSKAVLDIKQLPAGTYLYKAIIDAESYSGKIQK